MLLLLVLTAFAIFVVVIALNPNFWQGYRNSKFLDEYLDMLKHEKDEQDKDLIKK